MMPVAADGDWGKVAVLMGGRSAEREISLKSGKAVIQALLNKDIDVHGIDVAEQVIEQLLTGKFHRVFIALHGCGGEDGIIQGALETLGLPYTGSGVMGSALAMDKLRSKQLWRGIQLPTADFYILNNETDFSQVVSHLTLPLIVKPSRQGSSLGIIKVEGIKELKAAYQEAAAFDTTVFAERWLPGAEYTAGILAGQALPLIRLETPHQFYDFEAKYLADTTRYLCPCGLSKEREQALQTLALESFHALGASGWGRVDFRCDEQERPYLLEVNTVPGMTTHSLVPMAAKAAGIKFDDLILQILESSRK
ncbi:D-alanine--D-alanine ligase [Candidatus Nitrosoglobus terrae]|uniref:D-alanine--D-alanine ligase n=1 Tax=Candidatus Nitrosoglobus terrae TaxID=1630141 RepID=A0A1Q2SKF3_9GAMM|nr:D-alanine--D-alanine ligase [Candidatus Nitrosoglobus terrae]BAW79599.1 D-alanine--D-alanine ligase [Candidatus Nitrosoglobus terrae]